MKTGIDASGRVARTFVASKLAFLMILFTVPHMEQRYES